VVMDPHSKDFCKKFLNAGFVDDQSKWLLAYCKLVCRSIFLCTFSMWACTRKAGLVFSCCFDKNIDQMHMLLSCKF